MNMPGAAGGVPSGSHGDPPQPHDLRDIHVANLSNDELVSIINGSKASLAQGMPVLIVPSSDGRLAAVAVNGLQILVPTAAAAATSTTGSEEEQTEFRGWLLLLASLAASVTYTAALSLPDGVWGADDNTNGYVAGLPVLRDKFPSRFKTFYYCNTTAFVSSLLIIAMLSSPRRNAVYLRFFKSTVALCLISLGGGYIAATWVDTETALYSTGLFAAVLTHSFSIFIVGSWLSGLSGARAKKQSKNAAATVL